MKGLKCLISGAWWNAAGTRAIKTAAQTTAAAITVGTIWEVDWVLFAGLVLLAALMSLLTSLAGLPETKIEEGKNR